MVRGRLGFGLDRLEAAPRPDHGDPVLAHGVPLRPLLTPSPCPSQRPPALTFPHVSSIYELFHILRLSLPPRPRAFSRPHQLSPGTQPPFLLTRSSQIQRTLPERREGSCLMFLHIDQHKQINFYMAAPDDLKILDLRADII